MPAHQVLADRSRCAPATGFLIVNADDWGRDEDTTNRTLECARSGTVSSVSAMVFMKDSERAASLAGEESVEVGLHLNLTTPFSAAGCPAPLRERQGTLARYLSRNRLSQVVFHPALARNFAYVIAAQLEEFCRLYGVGPERIDGHHHMHLCANVLWGNLLPAGTVVRRSFSWEPGVRSRANTLYRRLVDHRLARRHRMSDFFFSLPPLEPLHRLPRIFSLARRFVVEVETHPINAAEYRFLATGEIARRAGPTQIVRPSAVPRLRGASQELA